MNIYKSSLVVTGIVWIVFIGAVLWSVKCAVVLYHEAQAVRLLEWRKNNDGLIFQRDGFSGMNDVYVYTNNGLEGGEFVCEKS